MRRATTVALGAALLVVCLAVVIMLPRPSAGQPARQPAAVGFTFSERQADYLDLSWRQAFQAAMDLVPNVVRFGAYWDSIEYEQGQYDFSTLDWMLDHSPPQSAAVVTVGMKAPRWPEFYVPDWLAGKVHVPDGGDIARDPRVRQAALAFIRATVEHERDRPNVKYWQVENEPLDAGGPHNWNIDPAFVAQEVHLVRSLDPTRPIVLSMFVDTTPLGALPPWRGQAQREAATLIAQGDILGLDVYPVRPIVASRLQLTLKWPLWAWEQRVIGLQQQAQAAGKQTWISEAQAEPWVPARLVAKAPPARNAAPDLTTQTVDHLKADGFNTILLWGVEYWYMRDERYKDGNWWDGMQGFFPHREPSSQAQQSADTHSRST